MSLQEALKVSEEKMKKTIHFMHHEFNNIRTGRASVSLVDEIKVEYYGNPTPLKQLATLSTPQPHLIVIQPWDNSVASEIERAILKSNLGLTPSNDGKIVRVSVPQLTTEKRQEMVKLARKIAEESKISIRSIRREANESSDKEKKDSTLSEDEAFKGHEQVQKVTDKHIKEIDDILGQKEKEIMEF